MLFALGCLSSEAFRGVHDATLKAGPPRLPLPPSPETFDAVVEAARALSQAWLRREELGEQASIGHYGLVSAPRGFEAASTRVEWAVFPLV